MFSFALYHKDNIKHISPASPRLTFCDHRHLGHPLAATDYGPPRLPTLLPTCLCVFSLSSWSFTWRPRACLLGHRLFRRLSCYRVYSGPSRIAGVGRRTRSAERRPGCLIPALSVLSSSGPLFSLSHAGSLLLSGRATACAPWDLRRERSVNSSAWEPGAAWSVFCFSCLSSWIQRWLWRQGH